MFKSKPKFEFEYHVSRRKRKTVSLIVEHTGLIRVLAPLKYTDKNIEQLLLDKQNWIMEKLRVVKRNQIEPPSFLEGTAVAYQGKLYTLRYKQVEKKNEERVQIEVEDMVLYSRTFETDLLKKSIENWYRKEAVIIINKRVAALQKGMDRAPSKISVKTQKKRWGSCTSKGHILLNWRLILAPVEVLDYVILHEMCHLYYMDHSQKFWSKVAAHDPNYHEKRNWLKQNGHIIRWPYDVPEI